MRHLIQRKVSILLICGLISTSLVSCAQTDYDAFDLNAISNAISGSAATDGGIVDPGIAVSTSFYSLLQDTYYSCLIARTLDDLSVLQTENIKRYFDSLTAEKFFSQGNDTISAIFYFLEISKIRRTN